LLFKLLAAITYSSRRQGKNGAGDDRAPRYNTRQTDAAMSGSVRVESEKTHDAERSSDREYQEPGAASYLLCGQGKNGAGDDRASCQSTKNADGLPVGNGIDYDAQGSRPDQEEPSSESKRVTDIPSRTGGCLWL